MIQLVMVVLCVTAMVGGPVSAEPSLRGYTGLIQIPTANALDRGDYNVGFGLTEMEDFDGPSLLANYGVADGLEAGLFWREPDVGGTETLINVKQRFVTSRGRGPSFAVGIADLAGEMERTVYAVGTWEVGRQNTALRGTPLSRLRLHGGVGGGMIDGFFVGVDTPVGDRINVMAEYLNRDVNFGVRARLWERFSVQASVLDMDDVAVSACYSWPLGRRTAGLDPIITADSTTPSGPPGPVATVQVKTDQAQMAKPPATAPANTAPVTPTDPAPTVQTTNETPATVTAGQPPATQPDKPTPTSVSVTPESPRDPFAVGTQVDPGKPEVPMVLDVFPEVENGEVCVPVRAVAQWLGFRVKAEAGKRGIEVTVFAGQDAVSFLIGDDRVCFQGETVDLPAATYYHRQRTAMAPAKLFRLLGVPTETDADAGRALFERHDVIGIAACGK